MPYTPTQGASTARALNSELLKLVDEHEITSTAVAPTMLQMILQHPRIEAHVARGFANRRLARARDGNAGRGARGPDAGRT